MDQLVVAGDDARLRAAQQLVAAERDEIHASFEALLGARLVHAEWPQVRHAAAAEVFVEGDVVLSGQGGQLVQRGLLGETGDAEVGMVDGEDEGGVVVDGLAVVVEMGLVGGADFAEDGAGAGHDVGNAEAFADLDELSAGDDDFAAGGQFVEDQIDGGGVVVDGDAGLAEEALDEIGDVHVAAAAAAGGKVVLEVRVAGDELERPQGGAAQIRMQDDAGGVDHRPQRGALELRQAAADHLLDRGHLRGLAAEQLAAEVGDGLADLVHEEIVRKPVPEVAEVFEHLVDRGQLPQSIVRHHLGKILSSSSQLGWRPYSQSSKAS